MSVGGVSVRGSSHVRDGRPNQDAVAHARDGDWSFLAVADGHGSAPHYRSDRGATFAVETALALLRRSAADLSGEGAGRVLAALADDLVAGWRDRVEVDIRASPVREPVGFESLAVYGSTCLAAAIGPGLALFLQIGDGDLLAAGPDGETERAIPADPDLTGPGTYSLCQPDATRRVHLRLFQQPHRLSAPVFVLAATDGLSKSYRADPEFLDAARFIRDLVRTKPVEDVLTDLEPWLEECSRVGSRDDMTIAIFSSRPGAAAPALETIGTASR